MSADVRALGSPQLVDYGTATVATQLASIAWRALGTWSASVDPDVVPMAYEAVAALALQYYTPMPQNGSRNSQLGLLFSNNSNNGKAFQASPPVVLGSEDGTYRSPNASWGAVQPPAADIPISPMDRYLSLQSGWRYFSLNASDGEVITGVAGCRGGLLEQLMVHTSTGRVWAPPTGSSFSCSVPWSFTAPPGGYLVGMLVHAGNYVEEVRLVWGTPIEPDALPALAPESARPPPSGLNTSSVPAPDLPSATTSNDYIADERSGVIVGVSVGGAVLLLLAAGGLTWLFCCGPCSRRGGGAGRKAAAAELPVSSDGAGGGEAGAGAGGAGGGELTGVVVDVRKDEPQGGASPAPNYSGSAGSSAMDTGSGSLGHGTPSSSDADDGSGIVSRRQGQGSDGGEQRLQPVSPDALFAGKAMVAAPGVAGAEVKLQGSDTRDTRDTQPGADVGTHGSLQVPAAVVGVKRGFSRGSDGRPLGSPSRVGDLRLSLFSMDSSTEATAGVGLDALRMGEQLRLSQALPLQMTPSGSSTPGLVGHASLRGAGQLGDGSSDVGAVAGAGAAAPVSAEGPQAGGGLEQQQHQVHAALFHKAFYVSHGRVSLCVLDMHEGPCRSPPCPLRVPQTILHGRVTLDTPCDLQHLPVRRTGRARRGPGADQDTWPQCHPSGQASRGRSQVLQAPAVGAPPQGNWVAGKGPPGGRPHPRPRALTAPNKSLSKQPSSSSSKAGTSRWEHGQGPEGPRGILCCGKR